MRVLVVVPNYPTTQSASYQFTHQRVKEYQGQFSTDVFSCNAKQNNYEYEGVRIYTIKSTNLYKLADNYDCIIFHTLNLKNAIKIRKYLQNKKVIIWFHGTDSISWKRRLDVINFRWSNLYKPILLVKTIAFPFLGWLRKRQIQKLNYMSNVSFVFVSNWHYRTSTSDLKIEYKNRSIIPNFIDTSFYSYKIKAPEDRFNILSINNYASNIYAGDIIQDIILKFSEYKEFEKFNFNIYGDGKLFDQQTKKIKRFKNVIIKQGFLNPLDIKKVHSENGVFLYPKRGDSQGVSRCEAMASGLVPIASDVEAISEFSPDSTSYLVNNDIQEFINVLLEIANNPLDYLEKSKSAPEFINEKCGFYATIAEEIKIISSV